MAQDGAVVISIDGEDSGFQKTTENLEKSIESLAQTLAGQGEAGGQAFQQAMTAMADTVQDSVSAVQGEMAQVGGNLSAGLWQGVEAQKDSLLRRLQGWCGSITSTVKQAFDIHSPSQLMREQVGRMLSLGMALGVEDGTDEIKSAITALSDKALEEAQDGASNFRALGAYYIENLTHGIEAGRDKSASVMQDWVEADVAAYVERVDARTDSIVAAKKAQMKTASDAGKLALQAEIDQLQDAAKAQKSAYQSAADEVTDAYKNALTQGYDEALSLVESRVTAITDAAQAQYDEIQSAIAKMQDKLTTSDLFAINDKTGSVTLANWNAQTAAVEAYAAALEALQEKGVSTDFLAEITDLDIDEATRFMEKLLSLSDEKLQAYVDGWETQRQTAKDVAEQFYADQLTALDDSFAAQLAEALASVPDTMANLGVNSVQGMIEGLYSQSGALTSAATDIVNRAIAAMKEAADIHSPSRKTRDLIGKNLAAGIGVGFESQMAQVYRTIQGTLSADIASLSTDSAVQVNRQVAQSNAAYDTAQTSVAGTTVQNQTTVEFTGSLSALGRVLHPVIQTEQVRVGKNLVTGGA